MNPSNAFEIAQAVLLSLGGGGIIVFALSNWLGKVWANRLMATATAQHEKDLEKLNSELRREDNRHALNYKEKIDLYKGISEPIIELIVLIEKTGSITQELMTSFELKRLSSTSQLAMFAPMTVFEAYNNTIDYLYNCLERKDTYTFQSFRKFAFSFLSEIRRDIGIYDDDVTYSGSR